VTTSQRGRSQNAGGAGADAFDLFLRKLLFFVLSGAIAAGGVWFVATARGGPNSGTLAARKDHGPYHTVQMMICVKPSSADTALRLAAGCLEHMNVREQPFTIPLADGRVAVCVGHYRTEAELVKAQALVKLCRAFRLHPDKPARFPEARTVKVEARIGADQG